MNSFFHEFNQRSLQAVTRRHFFGKCATGIGGIALASLLNENLLAARSVTARVNPLAPKSPHFAPRAKRAIYLHMAGAPSQLDLFDYKPKLKELNGQPCPESLFKKERFAFIKGVPKMLGTPHSFSKHGQAGAELSDLLPHLGELVDDICIVKSMRTEQFNHAPAQLFLHTGAPRQGRPGMGAWLSYGLGSETQNLPGFVVLVSGGKSPDGGASLWGSAFLPTVYQGVQCRSQGDPVLFVSNPPGMTKQRRRQTLDAVRDLNQMRYDVLRDPEISTRIAAYELAYRMQTSVPDVMDISKEPPAMHEAYGTTPGRASWARLKNAGKPPNTPVQEVRRYLAGSSPTPIFVTYPTLATLCIRSMHISDLGECSIRNWNSHMGHYFSIPLWLYRQYSTARS